MSAKTAKKARTQLARHVFPEKVETVNGQQVVVDHNRRIRSMALSEGIKLWEAIHRYAKSNNWRLNAKL